MRRGLAESSGRPFPAYRLVLLGCIALLLAFGTAQVAHGHELSQEHADSHGECPLCVIAHLSIKPGLVMDLAPPLTFTGHVAPVLPHLRVSEKHVVVHTIRPPPVVAAFA